MQKPSAIETGIIHETLTGIVDRVTYHNPENGWSVLQVLSFDNHHQHETVVVHQIKVYAGATMEFKGSWMVHPKHGRQFKATDAVEKKPATTAALEKYLGSGMIKGVGPKTAKKIVRHFGDATLDVFEESIERLKLVPGIAEKKLDMISTAWTEHRAIRNVMMFLQSHGISTLFAVRIYKEYGDSAIDKVTKDPYRLANDFYGIGFFSADRVAISIGLSPDSPERVMAGISHVLAASREEGHCYLTGYQIRTQAQDLLNLNLEGRLPDLLDRMQHEGFLMVRRQRTPGGFVEPCYYSKSLFYDELFVARKIRELDAQVPVDKERVQRWIDRYCEANDIQLSDEQAAAVLGIAGEPFSILTGGPGCGKTTTTRVLVKLLEAMKKTVMLAAPTGRAAQRMMDVIGKESKTIHRLLEWQMGNFKKNEESPLKTDFLIVDECSMLDITLTASLLKAVPIGCQVLFIGDADQLPSVGAGNVLNDLIAARRVPCFRLTEIFRQAKESLIVQYAHQINEGQMPYVESPFQNPGMWREKADCLFLDVEEATAEQIHFIGRVKRLFADEPGASANQPKVTYGTSQDINPYEFRIDETVTPYGSDLTIPKKFQHVNLETVAAAENRVEELVAVLKTVHPWSGLHYGLSATDIVQKLYLDWIPKYFGNAFEIQVLCPMTRGSLGTINVNKMIQATANPQTPGKAQLTIGERILREGDRVIHRRNDYDLNVFNGDIGVIQKIDTEELTCVVSFFPDRREVLYRQTDIVELDLAYAITIHKSQGSEFEAVIIPVLTQHFKMLFRNLIYTGLTRARKLAVFVGTRKALAMAVKNQDTRERQTALQELLKSSKPDKK
ncbi:MAG: recombinase RecD [Desulfobacteraceae bacterium]|nr:MAG: recombinase RecD [Desulfobacteraceae bacterium]